MKPSEILKNAADLIEPEGAWTQRFSARDVNGRPVPLHSESAKCWCISGAIRRVIVSLNAADVLPASVQYVRDALHGGLIPAFNDFSDRTQTQCVSKLREASELARTDGR